MQVSVMLKPVSSSCNLNCKYCFYNDVSKNREYKNYGIMSEQTLENTIKKLFEYSKGDRVYISFHGGEPLLRGIDFFKTAVTLIEKYNKSVKSEVILTVQTNGTLINDEWCQFFKQNNFLVGVSLDGDAFANSYRVDKNNNQVFDSVVDAIDCMQCYDVDFNILSVVTKKVANNIKRVYEFFTSRGYKYLQFTPCLKPIASDYDSEMYMSGKEYGEYLINLTTMYFNDYVRGKYTSVRQIDNFVRLSCHKTAYQCGMNGNCSYQFTVEADGTVFPCDYYCTDKYILGNINKNSFYELASSNIQHEFVVSSTKLEEKCKTCKYYALCKNGCKRERADVDKCNAYNMYFDAMLKHLQFIGKTIKD